MSNSEFKLTATVRGHDIEVTVTYPPNQGVAAVAALHRLGREDSLERLVTTLYEDGDESIVQAVDNGEGDGL